VDPILGRPTIDGIAGARSDLAPAPSLAIATGAPTGAGATNRIVMTYVSGEINAPHVYFTESTDGGNTWLEPRTIETSGDRGYYTAPAISPNGRDVYVVYNAFTTPYQPTTATPRSLVGVVLHADSPTGPGATGAFAELQRGVPGDPRASSQNNLVAEFLGDYVYAARAATDRPPLPCGSAPSRPRASPPPWISTTAGRRPTSRPAGRKASSTCAASSPWRRSRSTRTGAAAWATSVPVAAAEART